MVEQLQYGTTVIDYELTFAERRTLGIRVHPDGAVAVVAPVGTGRPAIREKLLGKAAWIRRQQDFFLSFRPRTSDRQFVSGEGHYYLGKRYRLKVERVAAGAVAGVKLGGGYFHLRTPDPEDTELSRRLLHDWYAARAAHHFPLLLAERLPAARRYYDGPVELRQRWLTNRWGTCRRSGTITLNLELIKAPRVCIEYVIVHELCHLRHFSHSRAFYELLDREWPGWPAVKERLELLLS